MDQIKDCCSQMLGGWIPDIPDHRDWSLVEAPSALQKAVYGDTAVGSKTDLLDFFGPVENQGNTLTTTAFSCGGLVDYFNRRCCGRLRPASKLFLHGTACRLHGVAGDGGVSIRQVLKTLARVGSPPVLDIHRPTDTALDLSFDPLLFSFARDYADLQYVRIDSGNHRDPLQVVRRLLWLGMPCVFGMPLFSSTSLSPEIDHRPMTDEVIGGTSGILVGYDDNFRMSRRGALLFRSSWGADWGESGYGWLSYRFMERGLIRDIWTIFHPKWSESGELPWRRTVGPNGECSPEAAKTPG